jgi:hypothetical protein
MSDSNPAWQFFAALQKEAAPNSVHRSSARDEALDTVLDEIATKPQPFWDSVRKRFNSLCRNRLSKHIHRRGLERDHFRATHRRAGTNMGSVLLTPPTPGVVDQIAYAQLTDLIRTVSPEDELKLLLDIADGKSYAEMANDRSTTVASVKSKVFRVRKKILASPIAGTLRCWPRL